MKKTDMQFTAQKIRAQYTESEATELDALRALDAKVKRPANIFAYTFGSIGAVIMGSGMSLVMTDIGSKLGDGVSMTLGILIGVLGLIITLINYPIFKNILAKRKAFYKDEIISLSESLISDN